MVATSDIHAWQPKMKPIHSGEGLLLTGQEGGDGGGLGMGMGDRLPF